MSAPDDIRPATVLGAIRSGLLAEITTTPVERDIVMQRHIMWMLISSLGEVIDQIEALEEGAAAADRLTEELAIVRADRERWRLLSETDRAAWGKEVDYRRSPYSPMEKGRLERLHRRGVVVDLSEVFRRERAQPGPAPEGGAA